MLLYNRFPWLLNKTIGEQPASKQAFREKNRLHECRKLLWGCNPPVMQLWASSRPVRSSSRWIHKGLITSHLSLSGDVLWLEKHIFTSTLIHISVIFPSVAYCMDLKCASWIVFLTIGFNLQKVALVYSCVCRDEAPDGEAPWSDG